MVFFDFEHETQTDFFCLTETNFEANSADFHYTAKHFENLKQTVNLRFQRPLRRLEVKRNFPLRNVLSGNFLPRDFISWKILDS